MHNGININPNFIFAINDTALGLTGSTARKEKRQPL